MTVDRAPLPCGCTPWTTVRCDEYRELWQESLRRHKAWQKTLDEYWEDGTLDDEMRRLAYIAERAATQAWLNVKDHLHPDDDHAGEPAVLRRDIKDEVWDDETGTTARQRLMLEGTKFEVNI